MNRRIFIVLSLCIVFAAYGTCYILLRASHRISHLSNAEHWHPEKRSPEHFVRVTIANGVEWPTEIAFKPLMFLEQAFHNICG